MSYFFNFFKYNNQTDKTTTTTTKVIYLPEYVQKYIIKILCERINEHNGQFRACEYKSKKDFKSSLENEKQVKKEIESISMVNKVWYNSISNQLYVSNDFLSYRNNAIIGNLNSYPTFNIDNESDHYIVKRLLNQRQQSKSVNRLLKDENIIELVLNIDHWDMVISKLQVSSYDIPVILFKLINYTIKNRYINLKRISISNFFKIRYMKFIEFGNIRIRDCICNFEQLPNNIKEIDDLELADGISIPTKQACQIFVNLNSIKNLNYLYTPRINIKEVYETISTTTTTGGNKTNCFSETKIIFGSTVTIEDFYYLLKLAPALKTLWLDNCFDNINFQLNIGNDIDSSGYFNSEIVNVCPCCDQDKNKNFMFYWNNVIQMLTDNRSLQSFQMNHECPNHKNYEDEGYYEPQPMINEFSNVFIDQFSSIFKSNKTISHLMFNNFKKSNQLIQKINNNSNGGLKSFKYNEEQK